MDRRCMRRKSARLGQCRGRSAELSGHTDPRNCSRQGWTEVKARHFCSPCYILFIGPVFGGAMEQHFILINLLVKLGVAAALASAMVRSVEFKSLLFREDRSWKQRIYLVLWFALAEWIDRKSVV